MKYNRLIEECEYCEISYHPMTRWTKGSETIFVHEFTFDFENETNPIVLDETCEEKARAAGFNKRHDLTPRR